MPNQSTIAGYLSVIYLGHKAKQPLIEAGSELSDGLEPHGQFDHAVVQGPLPPVLPGGEGCTRGGAGWVGAWEGIPGTSSQGLIEAYLRNINLRLVHTAV